MIIDFFSIKNILYTVYFDIRVILSLNCILRANKLFLSKFTRAIRAVKMKIHYYHQILMLDTPKELP